MMNMTTSMQMIAIGARCSMNMTKVSSLTALPIMMFGGSPMRVAVPPMFEAMICVSRYLLAHKDSREVKDVFKALRPTIVGLIAAAALLLMTKDNFGSPADNPCLFGLSIVLFAAAFYFTRYRKSNPILVMLVCGIAGLLFY